MSSITHVKTVAELDAILNKSTTKLTVVDFWATWCGPCTAIAPKFESLSKQHKDVNFVKVDVDAAQEVASKYSIRAMPTFLFLRGNSQIDELKGANPGGLEQKVKQHSSGQGGSSFAGKGQTLGGGQAPATDGLLAGIDPQVQLLGGMIGVYLVYWYFFT